MTKLLNTVATRIQTRLSRKGLKVALGEIKDYLRVNVANIESITDVEVNQTTEHFMNNATTLTVITEDVEAATPEEITNEETSMCVGGETGNIEPTPEETSEALTTATSSSAIAPASKSELVTSTAGQMGIVLDASEIAEIATNLTDSTDTLEQDIDAIKAAIMAFVEHKALIAQGKIDEMIQEVREVVGAKNAENSQLLSDGLRSINNDIQEANKQFKSQVSKALSAFALPAIKAG